MDTNLAIRLDAPSMQAFFDRANKKKHSVNTLINKFIKRYLEDDGVSWAAKIIKELHEDIDLSTPLSDKADFMVHREPLRKMTIKCQDYKQGRSQFLRAAINDYIKGAWIYYWSPNH